MIASAKTVILSSTQSESKFYPLEAIFLVCGEVDILRNASLVAVDSLEKVRICVAVC